MDPNLSELTEKQIRKAKNYLKHVFLGDNLDKIYLKWNSLANSGAKLSLLNYIEFMDSWSVSIVKSSFGSGVKVNVEYCKSGKNDDVADG